MLNAAYLGVMRKNAIRTFRCFLAVQLAALMATGCVESEFQLASESRLPLWFKTSEETRRSELKVVLTYYTDKSARMSVYDQRSGKLLRSIDAESAWHKAYWEWAQKDWPKRSHPGYTVLSHRGQTEIIEHRSLEPIFYVSSEAEVQRTIRGK